jgi:mannose-6-phosphate isomerase-like protein (cupin superfamily)
MVQKGAFMAAQKTSKYIVNTPGDYPDELKGKIGTAEDLVPGVKTTHLITATDKIIDKYFYTDTTWLWSGAAKEPVGQAHTHNYSQVIGLIGGRSGADQDLGGEIIIWLDGHKETFRKNHLIYIPAGVIHGPFMFTRINHPVLFLVIAMNGQYSATPAKQPDKPAAVKQYSLMDHYKDGFEQPAGKKKAAPPEKKSKGALVLHIEDDMIPGAFYVDVVKVYEGSGSAPAPEHVHEWPELLATVGADPDHPREIPGEMVIYLNGEKFTTNKSSCVCIPAGVKHCPFDFNNIKSHTVIFSAGPHGEYTRSHDNDEK